MIKHIIIWKIKEEFSSDIEKIKKDAKENLEALVGQIDGLESLKLEIDMLPSSSGDMLLISELRDEAAFEGYRVSPIHNAVADKYVRPFTAVRLACDYNI